MYLFDGSVRSVRWVSFAAWIVFAGLIGSSLYSLFGPLSTEVGAAVGIVTGLPFFVMWARIDLRAAAIVRAHPEAIVAVARAEKSTMAWLRAHAERGTRITGIFSVSFDRSGVGFWVGGGAPRHVLSLPWKELDLSVRTEGKTYMGTPARLLYVELDDTELALQLFEPSRGLNASPPASEAWLRVLTGKIRAMLGLAEPSLQYRPDAYSDGRVAGITAWQCKKFVIPAPVTTLVFVPALTTIAGSMITSGSLTPGLAMLIVVGVLYVVALAGQAVLWAINNKENSAGYTTLNGRFLHLDQRHPTTGLIIRPAMAPALTRAQFQDALRRR
jgi:hypothetical protein